MWFAIAVLTIYAGFRGHLDCVMLGIVALQIERVIRVLRDGGKR
jgi:hypothetical protein